MKAVIQRVKKAKVVIDNFVHSEISEGLCVYLGIESGDTEMRAQALARKIANLRIFEDCKGKMNYSVLDYSLEILLISQFTLIANTSRGNRPDFMQAAKPDEALLLYEQCGKFLEKYGIKVAYGVFGANMQIYQENQGPVTIILENRD